MPTAVVLNGTGSYIEILHQGTVFSTVKLFVSYAIFAGEQVADDVLSAIAAGPNFVSINQTTQTSYVDVPDNDENTNILVRTQFMHICDYI